MTRIEGSTAAPCEDVLAIEEPLEIQVGVADAGGVVHESVSITMRTPGDDFALAAGFLFTEGILSHRGQIEAIRHWGPLLGEEKVRNIVQVDLRAGVRVDFQRLKRNFYTSSSCGVCGKSSIAALRAAGCQALGGDGLRISAALLHGLPDTLRGSQTVFSQTGGLHAAALFRAGGELVLLREDVGRHNAVDKVIGARFLAGDLPASDGILLVSGRASFELVQKAAMAGIPILAAVGAPSSLAVELASSLGMTLAGFVRDGRFNIYCGESRIECASGA